MKDKVPFIVTGALLITTLLMRAPITCVGPVAVQWQQVISMSHEFYGLLSAAPVFCLGIFCLAIPSITSRLNVNSSLLLISALLTLAIALRLVSWIPVILLSTIIIGGCIAILNSIVPTVVKHFYAKNLVQAMAVYTTMIGVSSTLGTYLSAPLLDFFGTYRASLGIWFFLGLFTVFIWIVTRKRTSFHIRSYMGGLDFAVMKKSVAWAVFLTMSMQSLSLYTVIAWLPTALQSGGFATSEAGLCVSLFVLASIPASLFTSQTIRICGGKKGMSVAMTIFFIAGVASWYLGGIWAYVGSILAGIPQGNRLTLAFILISDKTRNTAQMLSLTSLTLFIGYLIAGCGPLFCGLLYQDGNGVPEIMIFLALSGLVWGLAAVYAFGDRQLYLEK